MSNVHTKEAAFQAIGEEAQKLLEIPLEGEIRNAVERIVSIARYQSDIRTAAEQHASRT